MARYDDRGYYRNDRRHDRGYYHDDREYYRDDRGYYRDPRRTNEEHTRQRLMEAHRRMEDASLQCVKVLHETQSMANDTSEELESQAEALDRTEQRLDEMEVDLEASKRSMREVKSVFGSIVNSFSKPKFSKDPPPSKSNPRSTPKKTSRGGQKDRGMVQTQKQSTGNEIVDRNLDEVELCLKQLEGQAYLISHQLDESNDQIDRVKTKVDKNHIRMKGVIRDARRELS